MKKFVHWVVGLAAVLRVRRASIPRRASRRVHAGFTQHHDVALWTEIEVLGRESLHRSVAIGLLPPKLIARREEEPHRLGSVLLLQTLQGLIVRGGRASERRHVDEEGDVSSVRGEGHISAVDVDRRQVKHGTSSRRSREGGRHDEGSYHRSQSDPAL